MILAFKIFAVVVILSFLGSSRKWLLHPKKWHIGAMAMSYSALVLYTCVRVHDEVVLDHVVLLCVMVIGTMGLTSYWWSEWIKAKQHDEQR